MREYLEDVSKNALICVKELHDNCGCFRCKEEREKHDPEKKDEKEGKTT